jgi:hypothetical protein
VFVAVDCARALERAVARDGEKCIQRVVVGLDTREGLFADLNGRHVARGDGVPNLTGGLKGQGGHVNR